MGSRQSFATPHSRVPTAMIGQYTLKPDTHSNRDTPSNVVKYNCTSPLRHRLYALSREMTHRLQSRVDGENECVACCSGSAVLPGK